MGMPGVNGKSVAVRVIGNMLIGAGNRRGDYNVPVSESRSFTLDVPAEVVSAWYVPIDNLPDLVKFQTISPVVSGKSRVTVTVQANQDALIRILLLAEID
ncbi:MAG: hypothetical protein WCN85_05660 [Burkholderiales bacterium]|jgi:hypothetical protein